MNANIHLYFARLDFNLTNRVFSIFVYRYSQFFLKKFVLILISIFSRYYPVSKSISSPLEKWIVYTLADTLKKIARA